MLTSFKKKRKRKKIHIQTVTTSKVARFKSTPGSRLRSPCDSGLRGAPTPEERDILSPSPLSALCMNLCPSLIYIHIHSQQLSADMCACFLVFFFPPKVFKTEWQPLIQLHPIRQKKEAELIMTCSSGVNVKRSHTVNLNTAHMLCALC